MSILSPKHHLLSKILILLAVLQLSNAILDTHYYDKTCPKAESIILEAVRNASMHDPKVPARILRMFFHDCFIRVSISLLCHYFPMSPRDDYILFALISC